LGKFAAALRPLVVISRIQVVQIFFDLRVNVRDQFLEPGLVEVFVPAVHCFELAAVDGAQLAPKEI
jgi:hypothetical protein